MQIVLTVSAGGVAVAAMASGPMGVSKASGPTVIVGVAVASPLPVYCILLLAGGGLGLVVVRRGSHAWRLPAGVVLIAPAVLAVGSLGLLGSLPSEAEAIPDVVPDEVVRSLEQMLTLLTWAHWLAFLAVVVAAAAGVLILLSGRMAPHPPASPPSAS
jgi:hypothetical protein